MEIWQLNSRTASINNIKLRNVVWLKAWFVITLFYMFLCVETYQVSPRKKSYTIRFNCECSRLKHSYIGFLSSHMTTQNF